MQAIEKRLLWSPVEEISLPKLGPVPACEADFIPELYPHRRSLGAIRMFGETMSKKTSNTADARQKRG